MSGIETQIIERMRRVHKEVYPEGDFDKFIGTTSTKMKDFLMKSHKLLLLDTCYFEIIEMTDSDLMDLRHDDDMIGLIE